MIWLKSWITQFHRTDIFFSISIIFEREKNPIFASTFDCVSIQVHQLRKLILAIVLSLLRFEFNIRKLMAYSNFLNKKREKEMAQNQWLMDYYRVDGL